MARKILPTPENAFTGRFRASRKIKRMFQGKASFDLFEIETDLCAARPLGL